VFVEWIVAVFPNPASHHLRRQIRHGIVRRHVPQATSVNLVAALFVVVDPELLQSVSIKYICSEVRA
jgi:hypothetical protein